MRLHRTALLAIAAISIPLGFDSNDALAASVAANLSVQLIITASCTVTVPTGLNFGSVASNQLTTGGAAITGTGTISVTCTNGSPYAISLDNGNNYDGTNRRLQLGSGATATYLAYGLYQDGAYSKPWTQANTSTACSTSNSCVLASGSGGAQSYTVYGKVQLIANGPSIPAGQYLDTVQVLVIY